MANEILREYLQAFAAKAAMEDLPERKPGANWFALPAFGGSHISLSVRQNAIQVNLNNENDVGHVKLDTLWMDKDEIERELGIPLEWEGKMGIKKTAIRATLEAGCGSSRSDWDRQHAWAIKMMKAFDKTFGKRI